MRHVLMVLLVVVVIGCGKGDKGKVVPLDQVPKSFLETAKKKLPEVKFDHARQLPNGNYEIRGKGKNGKVREVELNPSGEVVEIE